ncbi:MAG: DUF4129 domain-containing protein [Ruminococcus sp.]|nr:DUF4129 domain-containing protein [Ruminococcus sp.]
MRVIQRTLLHFAAFAALGLSLYPILAMVFHYMGQSPGRLWLAEGFLLLVSLIALIHAILIRRKYRKKPALVNTSFFVMGILLGAAGFMLTPLPGGFMGVLSALAVFGVYQAGARLFFVEYDVLTHTYVYTGVCMAFILPSVIIWIGDHQASFLWQMILFLAVSGVFAIARNFSGMDVALQSQGAEDEQLPKGLLRYNRLLLCGLGVIVLLLVLLRSFIGDMLWTLVKTAVHFIGKALYWFAGLFIGKEQESGVDPADEPEILQQTAVQQNEWVTLICTLALAALVTFLLVRYRRKILEGLTGFIRTLQDWVMHLFGRSYEQPRHLESGGYTDYIMDLSVQETDWPDEPLRRRFHYGKQYRKFRRMERSAEKYRLGYGLLLYRLSSSGMEVRPSLSPREILKSLPEQEARTSLWELATSGYERVRYREESPSEEAFSALEQLLSEKL